MRRLIYLFFAFALLVACSKTDPDNPNPAPPTQQETVTLSPGTDTAPVIATAGGSTNVSFTASSSWTASIINTKADSWCSVAPTSGGPGSANITITVKENTTPDNRSASVVIKVGTATQTIKVEQKQKDALTVTASSFEVSAEGGQIKVATKSNVSFTHTISTSAQKWIQVVKTKALKDSTLIFDIAANDKVANRSGQIFLASGNLKDTVNVYQAGEIPTIVVSKDEYVLKSDGESFEVEVASNVNATMSMVYPEGVEAWITENTTKAISTNKFYFTAQANETYDSRSALLIFANAENNLADTVTVAQAQKDAIVLAKSEYVFDKKGGNLDFEIQTNVDVTVTIPGSYINWITQVETRAMETKQLHFNIASCDTLTVDRVAYIELTGGNVKQTIKVIQKEMSGVLKREREALIAFYKAAGGDNWTNNTNWCSDKPVCEWYGIQCNSEGFVTSIVIPSNNLTGVITDSIGVFTKLTRFNVSVNSIGGEIPKTISELTELVELGLGYNNFEGEILALLNNMHDLVSLHLSDNNFSGTFSEDCYFPNLRGIEIANNRFSGNLPTFIIELEKKSQDPNSEYSCWLEPQQAGYAFTAVSTKAMIDLGNSLYMHPAGIAVEYRMNEIKALQTEDAEDITKNIYNVFGDHFDFIAFLYNVGNMAEISGEIAGQYNPYSNDISGIGRDIFSNSDNCGSEGKLKGVLHLSEYRQIKGSFLHEIAHAWAAFDFGQLSMNYDGSVEADPVHWGISSVDGRLGGFKLSSLQRNVDGVPNKYKATCTNADNNFWFYGNHANDMYAPLELYLMGMIPSSDVPDVHYFTGVSGNSQEWIGLNGVFYAENENILTINDIISRLGQRTPDYTQSQKDFRCLVVVVTGSPVDDRRWSLIESDIQEMQKKEESNKFINFYEATGKRGTMVFDGLQSLKK